MLTLEESIISPILLGSTASDYQTFYLWSLPRKEIRTIVRKYNNECTIGEENILVSKIATDLENLNLHRTPLNCLTLLKVFEISFDESPVNRCEMLKQVLFVLFNLDNIPSYKTRPDLKDCEYALGYYCETMIRKDNYSFSREDFLTCMHGFCKKQLIELDTHVLFDILYQNNIIVQHSNQFCFRFSYWIHYFAAQRMHHSPEFSEFIFSNKGLSSYPEVIEFYTGIDRRREDALSILIKDLDFDCDKIESSYGAPNVGAVYKIAQWNPTEDTIQKMRDEVTESVKNSNLPDSIKDQYADRTYNPSRPYNQTIHKILEDYSMALLMKHTSAGARALRNSDYANVELKHQLFQAILRCFEQVANSILLISPLLANNGQAEFEGASFVLEGDFGADFQTKFNQILRFIPQNVIRWFVDDIFSQKMAPLIIQSFNIEENEIRKHLLALLLIKQKPRNWEKLIASYIKEKHKNSFYLLDTYDYLQVEYKYSHSSDATLKNIYELLSMTIARHNFSIKTPGQKALSKIMSQMQDFIPVRKRTEDDNL
jgi:hypothetical protein